MMIRWIVVVASMLGPYSRWTYPLIGHLYAALEHHINHVLPADLLLVDLDTATLPRSKHLVLTLPLAGQHDTVVRLLIQVMHILHAEIDSLMNPTHVTKSATVSGPEISLQNTSI